MRPFFTALGALSVAGLFSANVLSNAEQELREQRLAILRGEVSGESLAALRSAPSSLPPLIRRAAVRTMARKGEEAIPLLKDFALKDPDALTRRTAIRLLSPLLSESERAPFLAEVYGDKDEQVRTAALEEAAAMSPRPEGVEELLRKAQHDPSTLVSQTALQALWTFNAEVQSARERPEFRDHQLEVIASIPLGEKPWRFQTDPREVGHLENWMAKDLDESDWHSIGIAKPWQDFGHQYNGVAWYRCLFDLPRQPAGDAADLVFQAVDESAWVWLNGRFLGGHDIGPEGFNTPFATDTQAQLKWGGENVLVVRVRKPGGAHAGIWKPVQIEVLKKN